jgi:magnesium transporter
MIRYILFESDKGSVKKGSKADYPKLEKNQYLLIFLTKPGKEEVETVSSDFKFDKKPLTTFSRESHSRRYITTPFQFVMRTVFLEKGLVEFSNLLFILMNQCVIIASSKESDYYNEIVDDLFEELSNMKVRSIGHIFSNFLQEDVDENYEVLGNIEEKVKNIEFEAAKFETQSRIRVEDIVYLKSQLYKLSRQFWATTRVISLIRMGCAQIQIDRETIRILGDVHETFVHQIDVAAAQKEMLSDALNVYATGITTRLAVTSNELNKIVKRLTAYSVIILAPAILTGLYGMNFSYIPLAHAWWGFYGLLGAVVALMASIYYYAKKNDWL